MAIKEIHSLVNFICCVEFLRMGVFWTLSLIISHLRLFGQRLRAHKSITHSTQEVASTSDGKRPVCIITGATSGLGAAAAQALSKKGFFVILVGRSAHLLSKTMEEIHKLNESAQLKAFKVDLSSFSSIMKFKGSLRRWLLDMNMHSSIQLLINNAGILATSSRSTGDGFDEMMMTNYMGAFSLTKVLLPLLLESPVPSRIVNVSSFTHYNVNELQVTEELVSGKSFSKFKQYPFAHIYGCSKLCILLFSYELHRQISIIDKSSLLSINVADPGAVKTNIMREVPSCVSELAFSVLKALGLLQYPENGISSILDAALAPPGTSGMYFFGGKGRTINSSPLSYNAGLAERLWGISSDLFLELKHSYEKIAPLESTNDLVENF